jgi:hypothetical protein
MNGADGTPALGFDSSDVGDVGLTGALPPHPDAKAEKSRWDERRPITKYLDLTYTPRSTILMIVAQASPQCEHFSCRLAGTFMRSYRPDLRDT